MRLVLIALLSALLAPVAAAQTKLEVKDLRNHPFDVPFASERRLRMHLESGDYHIVGSDGNRIVVHLAGPRAATAKNLTVRLTETGAGADLRVFHAPKNELRVSIEIPRYTDLYVRMSGGDLDIAHVAGNKDVRLIAGDLTIDAGDPKDYAMVNASVRFGDVRADGFGEAKGWMGESLKTKGTGKYRLHAHVFAGDLMLNSSH
ncbi:MAG TPA: hypothetical protein VGR93_06800 [Candidatus Acidoferrales bacterium]|nr:hypothetical protein [Candidatus Acidoferrales bacterium]